jgi:hypothetical protein
MSKSLRRVISALVLAIGLGAAYVGADDHDVTLAVTMTNDPTSNAIQVYDAGSHAWLQTLATQGKGGAGGNARGIKQYRGELVGVVNNGSNAVAVFRRQRDGLKFEQLVTTTSAPVSIDFGNDHMYVAGATTVDAFVVHGNHVGGLDGTTSLELAGGGVPPNGSTAQIGVVSEHRLLVTLKTDPDPGTVDIVALVQGAVIGAAPVVVSAPNGTLTPFGFSVYPDGTALITLAHSSQDGLFRDGAFKTVIAAGQAAPCWTTRVGKYVFTANTGSNTISRLIATGNNVFVDGLVAANIPSGGAPSDIDADHGILGVINHGGGQSHLTLFSYNAFGELAATGSAITLGVPSANGIAIVPPSKDSN